MIKDGRITDNSTLAAYTLLLLKNDPEARSTVQSVRGGQSTSRRVLKEHEASHRVRQLETAA